MRSGRLGGNTAFRPVPYGRGRIGAGFRSGGNKLPLLLGEVKNHDVGIGPTALVASTTWAGQEINPSATTPFNAMVQGVGDTQRIGRSVREISMLIKGTVVIPAQTGVSAADTTPEVMIVLVRDTQTNGAAPNSEDCYKLPFPDAALCANPMRNLAFGKRFQVLKIVKFRMPMPAMAWNGTTIEQAGVHRDFSFFVDLKGHKTTFSGTTAVFASMQNDAISLFAACNNNSTAPALSYAGRLRFTDA